MARDPWPFHGNWTSAAAWRRFRGAHPFWLGMELQQEVGPHYREIYFFCGCAGYYWDDVACWERFSEVCSEHADKDGCLKDEYFA